MKASTLARMECKEKRTAIGCQSGLMMYACARAMKLTFFLQN